MTVWENFGSREDVVFCGVFDGHGPFGHLVARKVRSALPLKISALWDDNAAEDTGDEDVCGYGGVDCEKTVSVSDGSAPCACNGSGSSDDFKDKRPSVTFMALKESLLKAYDIMDRELKVNPRINCFCSGTTAVTLVKKGHEVIIGNLGDSRAILGTRNADGKLIAFQLTTDLKPNLPEEEERIKRYKGRVFALREEPEVARVWLPNIDSPGLAMARAFGDACLKEFGLISVPEITYRLLTESDEFMVLATDGVWDVLSNQEVVDIIDSAPTRSCASRFLVESAVSAWKEKFPTSKMDDVAVVCLYHNADSSSSSSQCSNHDLEDAGDLAEHPSEKLLNGAKVTSGTSSRSGLRRRNLRDTDTAMEETDWSALEGVSRANTLLKLP